MFETSGNQIQCKKAWQTAAQEYREVCQMTVKDLQPYLEVCQMTDLQHALPLDISSWAVSAEQKLGAKLEITTCRLDTATEELLEAYNLCTSLHFDSAGDPIQELNGVKHLLSKPREELMISDRWDVERLHLNQPPLPMKPRVCIPEPRAIQGGRILEPGCFAWLEQDWRDGTRFELCLARKLMWREFRVWEEFVAKLEPSDIPTTEGKAKEMVPNGEANIIAREYLDKTRPREGKKHPVTAKELANVIRRRGGGSFANGRVSSLPAWKSLQKDRKARNMTKKQRSRTGDIPLTKKMLASISTKQATGREDDPLEIIAAEDAFQKLLKDASPEERKKLEDLTPAQRHELVETVNNDPDALRSPLG